MFRGLNSLEKVRLLTPEGAPVLRRAALPGATKDGNSVKLTDGRSL
jgi:hypothetical protein